MSKVPATIPHPPGLNSVANPDAVNVPVVASRIDGSIGLLGARYPGFFPVGDTRALTKMLLRAENDANFYDSLRKHGQQLQSLFAPRTERQSWADLLNEFKQ